MNQTDFLSGIGVIGILATFLFFVFVAILAFLLPVYVMLINGKLRRLNAQMEALIYESSGKQISQISTALLSETQTNNALQRQLLRAYGHEPEV